MMHGSTRRIWLQDRAREGSRNDINRDTRPMTSASSNGDIMGTWHAEKSILATPRVCVTASCCDGYRDTPRRAHQDAMGTSGATSVARATVFTNGGMGTSDVAIPRSYAPQTHDTRQKCATGRALPMASTDAGGLAGRWRGLPGSAQDTSDGLLAVPPTSGQARPWRERRRDRACDFVEAPQPNIELAKRGKIRHWPI